MDAYMKRQKEEPTMRQKLQQEQQKKERKEQNRKKVRHYSMSCSVNKNCQETPLFDRVYVCVGTFVTFIQARTKVCTFVTEEKNPLYYTSLQDLTRLERQIEVCLFVCLFCSGNLPCTLHRWIGRSIAYSQSVGRSVCRSIGISRCLLPISFYLVFLRREPVSSWDRNKK